MALKESANNLAFLSPILSIRNEHLSKKDVVAIKRSLAFKIGAVCLVMSIIDIIINVIIIFFLGLETKWQLIETYGWIGLSGMIAALGACLLSILFQSISIKSKNDRTKRALCRIGTNILYIGLAAQMMLSLHGDAQVGLITSGEAVTPAIAIFALLLIVQPVFWVDAAILSVATVGGVIYTAIHCALEHNMVALFYYIVIAIGFLFADYIVLSILFYAETQRYCQVLRNEALYDTAMYDELTRCKNRYALREFLKENQKRWESKNLNLLIIMFDIDNFKEYNDQFSHPSGDYCLRNVADSIRKQFPSPNLDFYRYGGEEFLLFFEIRNRKDAKLITLQVKNAVNKLNIEAPEGAPKDVVTISVGSTLIITPTDFNFNDTLHTVDGYLYKAKNAGKDVCCLDGKIIK